MRRVLWPDFYGLWALRAWWAVRRYPGRPDVVVASVGPFSAMLVGAAAAKRFCAELVVDYRDLLAFGTYYDHGDVRTALDRLVERHVLRRVALVSTVSEPMVTDVQQYSAAPTVTVMNGFEPSDFSEFLYAPRATALRIVYCGQIYLGRRDPRPLFEAIRSTRAHRPDVKIEVHFYGRGLDPVVRQARETGIAEQVFYHGEVTHRESLALQADADLLLLLLWNDPRELAVLSGKLFEYMGARRPIVMLGYEEGVAADVVRSNNLGIVANEPDKLAHYLIRAAEEKARSGFVSSPPDSDLSRFTREAQSLVLLESIERTLHTSHRAGGKD